MRDQYWTDQRIAIFQTIIREADTPTVDTVKQALITAAVTLDDEQPAPRAIDLMQHPPGFDGVTCILCRGNRRIRACTICHGSFDEIQPIEKAWHV